jgi:hypothetical protein
VCGILFFSSDVTQARDDKKEAVLMCASELLIKEKKMEQGK